MIYNIANKMIKYANGNNYNIKHFLKVLLMLKHWWISKTESARLKSSWNSSNYSVEDIRNFMEKIFKTKTGIELLKSIHQV